ncbi:MAG TPA: LCP family protein, partial [Candidatus Paceibacterota bacterium]|nr:LCP family protein [Candidatus Paceibacterota bacterium]
MNKRTFIGGAVLIAVVAGSWAMLRLTSGSSVIVFGKHFGQNATANAAAAVTPIADDPQYAMPANDPNRLDVLLLGIRGADDVANGGSLTDTILLFSLDTKTGRAALTSIPRDLTLRVTDTRTEKINTSYVLNGLNGTKRLFSRILGIGIDNVVVVDFNAFKDVVDQLGGITIHLDKPFSEAEQWAGTASESYVFSL